MFKIKHCIFICSFLLLFAHGCTNEQKNDSTFTISGIIKNPSNGKVIFSQIEDVNRNKKRVIGEFAVSQDGRFGQDFELEPHIYEIDFYGTEKITLAIDKGQKIGITADGSELKNIKIDGSPDTNKLLAYEKFRKQSLDRLVKSVRNQIKTLEEENNPANKEKIEKLGVAEIENYEQHRSELNDFIKENMLGSIAIYPTTLRWDGEENLEFYDKAAQSIESKYPNLEITKRINEKVDVLKQTSIGGTATDINLPNRNGEKTKLSDIEAKYILIDFWASWCGPCRRESEKLENLYKKYKDQGFEIYGVSLDTDKQKWLEAIEKDKRTPWANVSTLEGFETPITNDYGVTALPAKFIIDSERKIIAKNLHGDKLSEKIEELLDK